MNIRACKGCRYFTKYYGNRDKKGERTVSNYWCVSKNGFIRSFPKQCDSRKEEQYWKVGEAIPIDGQVKSLLSFGICDDSKQKSNNGACSADEPSEKVQEEE